LPKSELASYRKWSGQTSRSTKGGKELVFPIHTGERVIAAIIIDGPFVPTAGQSAACRDVIANIEALALAQPGLFAGPFSHLSPEMVAL
jgi:hypothetical protein